MSATKKNKSEITYSQWAAELEKAFHFELDFTGDEDAFTVRDIVERYKQYNLSVQRAQRMMKDKSDRGEAIRGFALRNGKRVAAFKLVKTREKRNESN